VNVIETAGLTKVYPRVTALDNLTLAVPGGTVGLLGPNGAGKSTLLKILLGFLRPSRGRARALDLDPGLDPIALRRRIGYMPEVECFIPGMSAVEFVHLAARLTGLSHDDAMQRTHMALNYVGAGEERYRAVETYSTGMKQKVKLAQAIVHHPKLLLLDEPTSGLDPRGREEMLALIRDIGTGKGIDVILSSHILHDVESVCGRVVILHQGRLAAHDEIRNLTGDTEKVYEVRIKGDHDAFLSALRAAGLEGTCTDDGSIRIPLADGTESLLRAAVESGVQLRRLGRTRDRLEDLFARLTG
jgi:ABC-2 type transport system ATP-binding protein